MAIKIDIETRRKIFQEFKAGGVTEQELAKKYNAGICSIWHYVRGLHMKNIIPNKRYSANENYFDTIDTPEKAYWLGFLYADGCVRKNKRSCMMQLKLKASDRQHIESFNRCLNSNYPVKDADSHQIYKGVKKIRKVSILAIYSWKLFNGLVKHGCVPRKSLILTWPQFLRSDLARHFIRGYFDGDGCIHKQKRRENGFAVSMAGTEVFLSGVQTFLSSAHGIKSYLHPHGKIFRLSMNKKEDVLKLRDIFYRKATIYLQRKYDIFDLAY